MKRFAASFALVLCTIAFDSTAVDTARPGGGYINWLYSKYLGRAPEDGGFNFWVGQFQTGAMTLEDIRWQFQNGQEAHNYNGRQTIGQYYRDLLGREPDAAGWQWWTDQYVSGAWTLPAIRYSFAAGPEARGAVSTAYAEVLGRQGDPGGLDFYQTLLTNGWTLTDVRYSLFYSAENYARYPGGFPGVCGAIQPYGNGGTDVSAMIQVCIDATPTGGTLALPRGKFLVGRQLVVNRPMSIGTQFVPASSRKCDLGESHGCAEIKAAPWFVDIVGFFSVQSSTVALDHLVFNGNKDGRQGSQAAINCSNNANAYGFNVQTGGDGIVITNSVSKNGLCGSALNTGWGSGNRIENNTIAYNGYHGPQGMWSDGMTAGQLQYSVIANNEFIDNTDIDLIFGQCVGCSIQGNTITHSDNFSGSSFGALMLHAWPGWPYAGTSGDYTGADVSGNIVDCVGNSPYGGHRCGFGIYLGARAWYLSESHGGYVHDNVVNGAQMGFMIDNFHGLTIANNYVSETPDRSYATSCGSRALRAYNITPDTTDTVFAPPETIPAYVYEPRFSLAGCIPNWWQNPY